MATKFVIICAARTGSTMLRLLLNSHSRICSHGEIFGNPMTGFVGLDNNKIYKTKSPLSDWMTDIRNSNPVKFMNEFAFLSGRAEAIGFKIKYDELVTERFHSLLEAITEDDSIRIIHLTRRNRLKRFISNKMASRSGVTLACSEDEKPQFQKIRIDVDECLANIRSIEANELRFRQQFSKHSVFEITYEEMLEGNETLKELQVFLGIKFEELLTPTIKLIPDELHNIIENYKELCEKLSGTDFMKYID